MTSDPVPAATTGGPLTGWEASPRTVYLLRRDLTDEIVCEVGEKHRRYWHDVLVITPFEKWQDDGGYDRQGPSYRARDEFGGTYVRRFHYDNGNGWAAEAEGDERVYFDRPIMRPAFATITGALL